MIHLCHHVLFQLFDRASWAPVLLCLHSLEAVAPSLALLEKVSGDWGAPVWLNADIFPGPGGRATPLEAQAFLDAVGPGASPVVLSLGWTTGWSAETDNPGGEDTIEAGPTYIL